MMGDSEKKGMFEPAVYLPDIHLQSLSELERFRLQELALYILQGKGLCSDIKPGYQKTRKIVKRKQERKDSPHGVFGGVLSDVIAQDRAIRQRVFPVRNRRAFAEVESSVLSFLVEKQRMSTQSTLTDLPLSSIFKDGMTQTRRRGALSVDSITELDDGEDRLLEALQLSHSAELRPQQEENSLRLSLNPIFKQVPRIVERCCSHIEKYGLQTVGIFRIGSSKKRVEQLREKFAISGDMLLGEDTCVHDVSAVLKGFLRDLKEPLLPRELYTTFIHAAGMGLEEQLCTLQHLIFALPPCNADTLLRILQLLHKVTHHEKDTVSLRGEQVPGNKMSAANLATIFGPNLLQNERDLECEKQSFQDSAAQIKVTETLIQHHQKLYMVPSHTHGDIIMSLLQTDPEVVDYLLRRNSSFSQESDMVGPNKQENNQRWRMHVASTIDPQSSLASLMQMLSVRGKSGLLDSSSLLSKRRPSRSQEDLTVLLTDTPHRYFLPVLPRFLPLFTWGSSSPFP
ncbi:rho GTPase-activating protein 6-like isoform X2 [Mixophyes fleayi]|uniref:rho GTPase-activating protein 6-like isoform X2 n=1 Tax=Mixophyes fleayi TaxID=3061075 RepID=UPI003F4E3CAA